MIISYVPFVKLRQTVSAKPVSTDCSLNRVFHAIVTDWADEIFRKGRNELVVITAFVPRRRHDEVQSKLKPQVAHPPVTILEPVERKPNFQGFRFQGFCVGYLWSLLSAV